MDLEEALRDACDQSGYAAQEIADALSTLADEYQMLADDEPAE